ncbi:hypothetical protein [Leptolyngbya sp. Heron Island J]|nr:hypothetical protein [Leptolyngbya sp. Heron Island J]
MLDVRGLGDRTRNRILSQAASENTSDHMPPFPNSGAAQTQPLQN